MTKGRARVVEKRTNSLASNKKRHLRRLLILAVGIVSISGFTSIAYGMAYGESQAAVSGLMVYCETTIRVYHPPSPDHPFSHFIVTFGIRNPSSTDVNAHWSISVSDPSQNYYNADADGSFVIPRRGASQPQFSIYIGATNVATPPPNYTITANYMVSLFSFQRTQTMSNAPKACQ